jgi:hypothetical protein
MAIGERICNRFSHFNLAFTWCATDGCDSGIQSFAHLG